MPVSYEKNTEYCTKWRNKNPNNKELHRKIARKCMKRNYDWNKIRMIFLRILL